MTAFEVTVAARDGGPHAKFRVNTHVVEEAFRWGTSAQEIADVAAREFCDDGDVVVRRIGGGERVVVGRS